MILDIFFECIFLHLFVLNILRNAQNTTLNERNWVTWILCSSIYANSELNLNHFSWDIMALNVRFDYCKTQGFERLNFAFSCNFKMHSKASKNTISVLLSKVSILTDCNSIVHHSFGMNVAVVNVKRCCFQTSSNTRLPHRFMIRFTINISIWCLIKNGFI